MSPKKTIHLIAAARPNFMKIAPLYHALSREPWANPVIVHTGQHYDTNMSDAFFRDLLLPVPHYHLGIGSGTHAEQTGKVMIAYERLLNETRPDLVVVVGDVNSTLACTLATVKIRYADRPSGGGRRFPLPGNVNRAIRPLVAHLEAGLRSFDRSMPEEINRIATDTLADILWTPSADGNENLLWEGVSREKIERVGNIMIDSLEMMRPKIEKIRMAKQYGLEQGTYGLVTLHRPANVDEPAQLRAICTALEKITQTFPLVFPVHPRTRKQLEQNGYWQVLAQIPNLFLSEPLPYLQFMSLVFDSRLVITDSGGVQEETTYLGIPCLTLRENTERPITVSEGTNRLCTVETLLQHIAKATASKERRSRKPLLWDGHTADRVVASIQQVLLDAKEVMLD
ncbi:UDP-N-acetyl glucosamine 2-epimerase [Desulfobulbus elongatus]|uniref:UDP-N-acetyl glucosamine 2-epimerase n=1 Tax=Desulfobulbus elongatus TaxID=53332 RepID=UPI0005524BC7|nr:UDP-N-acetyl glucosamine 2-epimerase [Desulfobulbus elongatus]